MKLQLRGGVGIYKYESEHWSCMTKTEAHNDGNLFIIRFEEKLLNMSDRQTEWMLMVFSTVYGYDDYADWAYDCNYDNDVDDDDNDDGTQWGLWYCDTFK